MLIIYLQLVRLSYRRVRGSLCGLELGSDFRVPNEHYQYWLEHRQFTRLEHTRDFQNELARPIMQQTRRSTINDL